MTRVANLLRSMVPPTRLVHYRKLVSGATELVKQVMSAEYADSYGWKWLVRSYLLTEMHAMKITRLQVKDETLDDLMASFPDQCGWLSTFCGDRVAPSKYQVRTLMHELNYKDPIEMLTCDLCIFGMTRQFSVEDIEAGKQVILNTCKELQRNADQQAHPLVVLRAALGK